MSQPENTSAPIEAQELRSPLEIAHELLECMEAEILQIRELRSILVTVWSDPEATEHIKHLVGAGINASHFVSNGLKVLADTFKEELALLEPVLEADISGDAGGEA